MSTNPIHMLARRLFGKQHDALDDEQRRVIAKVHEGMPIARDAADVADEAATVGDRLADRVAAVGGSWGFIVAFSFVLIAWMLLNSEVLAQRGTAFDPYPYILLNLLLSTVAALQAPVIMMSQNRQASKDRLAASLDYEVNLRTELEMIRLHEKIDRAVVDKLDELIEAARRAVDDRAAWAAQSLG